LLRILTQDVISVPLGMPPSHPTSVASPHRRYDGDIESSDDPRKSEIPTNEGPQTHSDRVMRHELNWATSRRAFAAWIRIVREGSSYSCCYAFAISSFHDIYSCQLGHQLCYHDLHQLLWNPDAFE